MALYNTSGLACALSQYIYNTSGLAWDPLGDVGLKPAVQYPLRGVVVHEAAGGWGVA